MSHSSMNHVHAQVRRLLVVLTCSIGATALMPFAALAQHEHEHDRDGPGREIRGPSPARAVGPNRWWDGAYGHGRAYPVPGYRIGVLPPQARFVYYGGARYAFHEGVWYSPGSGGYVVIRPPYGVVIGDLPAFATVLTIGAVTYWYANGVYYRAVPNGGYEVAAPPVEAQVASAGPDRLYVYPRQGQSAEKQASDEYDCHRWAAGQSGFDPTAQATGTASDVARKADYARAQAACLDGRGYTVK